jgi:hypothetical protein
MAGLMARFTMANSAGLYPPRMAGTAKSPRRRKRAKVARVAKRKSKRASVSRKRGKARLVKGSAAAKRYMAMIRRKRRK